MVMCLCAQTLVTLIKADEAMLLSAFYHTFLNVIKTESKNYPALSITEEKHIPGKRWVLSRLHSLFGESLKTVCKHECYGTLLFHTNSDLVKALSAALGKGRKYPSPVAESTQSSVKEVHEHQT